MNKELKNQQGFSLMELMIAVAILGVISAFAVPTYSDYVRKTKRTDAKVELLKIAQMQESYFAQNLSYAQALSGAGGLGFTSNTVDSESDYYKITMATAGCDGTAANPCSAFTLMATPQASQVNDYACLNLTLTNTGLRGISGTGTVISCWR